MLAKTGLFSLISTSQVIRPVWELSKDASPWIRIHGQTGRPNKTYLELLRLLTCMKNHQYIIYTYIYIFLYISWFPTLLTFPMFACYPYVSPTVSPYISNNVLILPRFQFWYTSYIHPSCSYGPKLASLDVPRLIDEWWLFNSYKTGDVQQLPSGNQLHGSQFPNSSVICQARNLNFVR